MNDILYGAQTPFLRLMHPEMERDYEDDDGDADDGVDEKFWEDLDRRVKTWPRLVHCPYCDGCGDQAWFEKHVHENPFGDEK